VPTGAALTTTTRRVPHGSDDGPGALRSHSGFGVRPWAKAGKNAVGPGDRRFERCRGRAGQVGGDRMYLPGQLAGVPYDSGDVVACGDGLLQELPADTPGRCEDRELHLSSR